MLFTGDIAGGNAIESMAFGNIWGTAALWNGTNGGNVAGVCVPEVPD